MDFNKDRAAEEAAKIAEQAREYGREFEDASRARFGKKVWFVVFAAVVGMAVFGSMLAKCAAGG